MPELQHSPVLVFPTIALPNELESALPLEITRVSVQITGPLATVIVEQRFGNPLTEPAELDYLYPLPEEAAITGFTLRAGSRRIQGDLQEQKAAQAAYEEARGQGKQVGLLEQRRPNLFAVRLANLRPGETIDAVVTYQQRLKFEDGAYKFIFPMGLTPKYDSPLHRDEAQGVHAPVARADEKIGPVEISLSADAGMPAGDPTSPSHPLEITRVDERRFQARLTGQHIPDRDFVLRYSVSGPQAQAAGWSAGEPGKELFLATLVPPVEEEEAHPQPREFIFVLDRSGSMTGQPIAQARNALRACLRALNPEDTFYLLLFDNDLEWFQREPAHLTQAMVDQADAYLSRVEGRGGTEIVRALEAVLNLPADPRRARYVVFLTDGAVSAEARALEQIRGKIGSARLFTFGIGSSVNRALLSRMAGLGRGRASFLQLDEDIEGAIIRFQDSVSFPIITDLTLDWHGAKAWDLYPARLPDLYFGQPLEICGRLARSGSAPARLTLRGKRAGKPVTVTMELPAPSADPAIGRVWARARIDDLLEQQQFEPSRAESLRAEILGLAMEYNLATPFTSFVAVDQDTSVSGGSPRVIHIAQPLPHGVSFQAFGGMPQTNAMNMMASPVLPSAVSFLRKMATSAGFVPPQPAPPVAPQAARRVADRSEQSEPLPDLSTPSGREQALRLLARTQRMDGSWNADVEWTAAALLAFVRAGHTTRVGSFRQALRRAARWLAETNTGEFAAGDFAAFARALALEELARATGDAKDRSAADAARTGLPAPSNDLEAAAAGKTIQPPSSIRSLDDLRLAAILKAKLPVPQELIQGVGAAWAITF